MPPKAFKPPRPKALATSAGIKKFNSSKHKQKESSKPRPAKGITHLSHGFLPSLSPDSSQNGSQAEESSSERSLAVPHASKRQNGNDDSASEEPEQEPSNARKQAIPPALLMRILQEFFKEKKTRISSRASKAVTMYMETFVREAIARAAFERNEKSGDDARGGGWLEVKDLEKLAPQLLLDF